MPGPMTPEQIRDGLVKVLHDAADAIADTPADYWSMTVPPQAPEPERRRCHITLVLVEAARALSLLAVGMSLDHGTPRDIVCRLQHQGVSILAGQRLHHLAECAHAHLQEHDQEPQ
ncbi:hypothetical protein [Streptomyces sp. NBC_01304]|uniref:hypothetical protein n=1 Tax=Streptomyces sp. NBC_01304 TaxID=2903818 RepID=UPI002E1336E1|nr:hypothetical protein OG430_44505 [Streptomyces sp. NBC_01304]